MKLYQNIAQAQKALAGKDAKIERLRKALKNVRGYIKHCDHEPALDEIDAALADG